MKEKKRMYGIFLLVAVLLFAGCTTRETLREEGKPQVVATTTMLADLARVIGGELVQVNGLMGPGIDPHLYQASAGDVTLMQSADLVVYTGMHLEGKMGDLFESLTQRGRAVICIADGLEASRLMVADAGQGVVDPHIWFDVTLWQEAAKVLAQGLAAYDPENEAAYFANLEAYLEELETLHQYIVTRTEEVPEGKRVLVTAHDAFGYFGRAYGYEVVGLQGISTEAEAGTSDVSSLADFIVEREIKAVFIESSIPPRTIEALQEAVQARGFAVAVGGELYSDSIGGEGSEADTYIKAFQANIDTIVDALR